MKKIIIFFCLMMTIFMTSSEAALDINTPPSEMNKYPYSADYGTSFNPFKPQNDLQRQNEEFEKQRQEQQKQFDEELERQRQESQKRTEQILQDLDKQNKELLEKTKIDIENYELPKTNIPAVTPPASVPSNDKQEENKSQIQDTPYNYAPISKPSKSQKDNTLAYCLLFFVSGCFIIILIYEYRITIVKIIKFIFTELFECTSTYIGIILLIIIVLGISFIAGMTLEWIIYNIWIIPVLIISFFIYDKYFRK
ncbi:hypothetical protein [Megamonas hypermegale]|uniref:hypothetical protein n=1 Tax=Megamonas hypermegale TaxID=158847 RepID=UPI0026EDF242|nr:hypothetical protein [Megamonas hypermegale]